MRGVSCFLDVRELIERLTRALDSFETYELDPPPYTLHTTKAELKQMYHDMVSIR